MNKLHKIEMIVADLEGYNIDCIKQNINRALNTTAMNSVIKFINTETKDFVWFGDEIILNYNNTTPKQWVQYFENVENDEYQTYLKLKEKFENE